MKLPEKLMLLEQQYQDARALMMRDSSVYAEVKIVKAKEAKEHKELKVKVK